MNCTTGEDLHDGATFEMFLDHVKNHVRANILYDPSHLRCNNSNILDFIDIYHQRIKAFHVKDAEFNPTGRRGVQLADFSRGLTAPDVSDRLETVRLTFDRSFRSSRPTTTRDGPCWSGNAR